MVDISSLIDLRFDIIKVLKDSKTRLSFDEIRERAYKRNREAYTIENYYHAITDLAGKEILDVEFEEGISPYSVKIIGNGVISASIF